VVAAPESRTVTCSRCDGDGKVDTLGPEDVPVPKDAARRRRRGGPTDTSGFSSGDPVNVPDPDNEGARIRATFQEVAVGEPIDGRDAAWVIYGEGRREGTTGRVPYFQIRSAT
jgi:hypothetical protein